MGGGRGKGGKGGPRDVSDRALESAEARPYFFCHASFPLVIESVVIIAGNYAKWGITTRAKRP